MYTSTIISPQQFWKMGEHGTINPYETSKRGHNILYANVIGPIIQCSAGLGFAKQQLWVRKTRKHPLR